MRNIQDYMNRKRAEHGDKFNPSDLYEKFHKYYNSGERVKIHFAHGETVTGTIGVTTGWKPAFLLMRRSNSLGSSDVLLPGDRVIAVKRGRSYISC